MNTALSVLLVILSIYFHELGHAYAMYKKGIKFQKIGLGIPVPFLPSIKIRIGRWPGVIFQFDLLILGAYVKCTAEEEYKIEELPYSDKTFIYGAGILANFLFGCILFLVAIFVSGHPFLEILTSAQNFTIISIMLFLILARKFFCNYLIAFLGLVMAYLLISSLIQSPAESMVGPIGIGKTIAKESTNVSKSIGFAGFISLLVGLTNALPLYPFDGGRIFEALVLKITKREERIQSFRIVTGSIFALLIILAIFSDVYNLFK